MKIFPKTFLYTLTLLVLIALLANGLIYVLMPKVYIDQKQHELTDQTNVFVDKLENAKREQDIISIMADYAGSTQANLIITIGQHKYSLFSWGGGVITQTGEASADVNSGTDVSTEDSSDSTITTTIVTASDSDVNINEKVHYGIITSGLGYIDTRTITEKRSLLLNGEEGMLTAAVTLAPVNEAVDVIVSLLPVSLLMCAIIAIIFSLLYARAITRPIKLISSETVRMTTLNRAARCEIKTKDEFGVLADNVNGLYKNLLSTIESLETELNKVGVAERAKTDFMRAASHELKTPVTAVSVIMDNIILGVGKYKNHEEWLPKCKELVDGLSKKLREILDASQLEGASEPPITESIEILCAEILAPYMLIARAKGLSVYIDWSGSFKVTVPPKLLEKALSNIFSNAVQYTVPGGRFSVYCRGRSLIVDNECTPINDEQFARLYEPFYKPDSLKSRETGGNGLGLYIVKTVFRLLELDYRFEPMTSPDGMRFTINF
jgi:two-component system sensor kinase Ihk